MPPLALSGLFAAAVAVLAEIVVFRPFDRPLDADAARIRIIAASFVGGLAVLGVVVAMLALSLEVTALAFPAEVVLPMLLAGGAFGIAFAFRRIAARDPFTARDRARAVVSMAMAQGIGVIGVVAALLALFLGE